MCTRILWNCSSHAVMTGRTMDWPESTRPVLTALPRGMARNGGMAGGEIIVTENPARWTSVYGSLVTTAYGIGTSDGINEKGLGIHMLFLNATDFGIRNTDLPGLQAGLWGQYLLDNAATVAEALDLLAAVQIVMVETNGHRANLHLAIEDADGDSAIVEYIEGEPVVHHGRDFVIMTNDPAYDAQLAILETEDFSHPASNMPLPGNVNPIDRFARAAYFLSLLPDPESEREAAASILAIARNASVPFGAPYKGFGIYSTEYRTATNLNDQRYYFELSNSPNVIWVELTALDLDADSPVQTLDPDNIELSGNVTSRFTPAAAPF